MLVCIAPIGFGVAGTEMSEMEVFLPAVTNIRSPTIFAPVVRPTSCLIEPRYSTFGDMTASGSAGAAAPRAGGPTRHSVVRRAARVRILRVRTGCTRETCAHLLFALLVSALAPAVHDDHVGDHAGHEPRHRSEERR